VVIYPFTEDDLAVAYNKWHCNCGPSALAFALQISLDKVRGAIPGFEERRYTSPTMMKGGLRNLGASFEEFPADLANMFRVDHTERINLVRVQWCGPWTKRGANPKWAYRQTHWIATWSTHETMPPFLGKYKKTRVGLFVFDCNGGIRSFDSWKKEIVPTLVAMYPRADGAWFPTHVWSVSRPPFLAEKG
jgi:hypothetical protein